MINRAMIREVNELKIYCTNHSEGCGWVGQLGELKNHLDSDKGVSIRTLPALTVDVKKE